MPTLDCLHRYIFLLHVYRSVSLACMRRYMQLACLFHQCAKSLLSRDSRIADCTVRHPGVERPFSSFTFVIIAVTGCMFSPVGTIGSCGIVAVKVLLSMEMLSLLFYCCQYVYSRQWVYCSYCWYWPCWYDYCRDYCRYCCCFYYYSSIAGGSAATFTGVIVARVVLFGSIVQEVWYLFFK